MSAVQVICWNVRLSAAWCFQAFRLSANATRFSFSLNNSIKKPAILYSGLARALPVKCCLRESALHKCTFSGHIADICIGLPSCCSFTFVFATRFLNCVRAKLDLCSAFRAADSNFLRQYLIARFLLLVYAKSVG